MFVVKKIIVDMCSYTFPWENIDTEFPVLIFMSLQFHRFQKFTLYGYGLLLKMN